MAQPLNSFQFQTIRKLVQKRTFQDLNEELELIGKNPLVVCGSSLDRYYDLCKATKRTLPPPHQISKEPTIETIEKIRKKSSSINIDFIIGIGGGSVLDSAKALAALIPQKEEAYNYLEIIGKGLPLEKPPLRTVLIPTTSGTGSEATKNAVLEDPQSERKVSLRSKDLFAELVWLNPLLTLSLPKFVTAACGLDALTQLLEAYVSLNSNSLTDMYCEKGFIYLSRSLKKAYEAGEDVEAREEMQLASFFSGVALANAGLGAVHGLAAPLGSILKAPHGSLCAALLYSCTKENIEHLLSSDPLHFSIKKYTRAAQLLTQIESASYRELLDWIRALTNDLKMKSIESYGLSEEKALKAVQYAQESNSMKGNPCPLSNKVLLKILLNGS